MSKQSKTIASLLLLLAIVFMFVVAPRSFAIGSSQNPQSSTVGLEGTIPSPPPTQAASIGIPTNGQSFTEMPITVSGLCKTGLLVKVFSNNVFIGSVTCTNNSFSLQVDLFGGLNDLVAKVFDALDQQGPDSNAVGVTFNDAQFVQFGTRINVTSTYARQGVNPGTPLNWPFIITGGTPPYAISADWGDGSGPQLKSVSFPGIVTLSHTYNQAGVYNIALKATDANGTSAYLQVVGVANGKISGGSGGTQGAASSSGNNSLTITILQTAVILWPLYIIAIPLLVVCFWLGRRYELFTIRKSIEESREQV